MRHATAACLAAILALPAWAGAEDHADHRAELGGLRALHAWTPASDAAETLVFVELRNEGSDPVTLTGGRTDAARAVTLVGFRLIDGAPGHEPVGPVPIAPGHRLHLEPDGLALRLAGLIAPLREGDTLALDLTTSLGTLAIQIAVEPPGATAHPHAGHSH